MTAREYLVDRWERIHAVEKEELRRSSPEQRLQQFFALMEMARALGWETSTAEEKEQVRRRWRKLKGCRD